MDRDNHYETAFAAYLRKEGHTYIATDESRRTTISTWDEESVKSLDFIVQGTKLLIDVKGRKFPGGSRQAPQMSWQNWCGQDDIKALLHWKASFGDDYQALLVFVYDLQPWIEMPLGTVDLWHWRKHRYLLRAIAVEEYQKEMRVRSPRWKTVHLPMEAFRRLIRPFERLCKTHLPHFINLLPSTR